MSSYFRYTPLNRVSGGTPRPLPPHRARASPVEVPASLSPDQYVLDAEATQIVCAIESLRLRAAW